MLPSILEIARHHGLQMDAHCSSRSAKEVRFKCPFCEADTNKKEKYYLSLNLDNNLFKCWSCCEAGGVLKFIALLEHKSIEEVKLELWGSERSPRRLHPAEKLTPQQIKAMGFVCYSWGKQKRDDPAGYKRTLNWVWQEWQQYSIQLKRLAYIGLLCLKTTEEIHSKCKLYAEQLGMSTENLLFELTTIKFSRRKPEWAKSAEWFVEEAKKAETKVIPDRETAGSEKRSAC